MAVFETADLTAASYSTALLGLAGPAFADMDAARAKHRAGLLQHCSEKRRARRRCAAVSHGHNNNNSGSERIDGARNRHAGRGALLPLFTGL